MGEFKFGGNKLQKTMAATKEILANPPCFANREDQQTWRWQKQGVFQRDVGGLYDKSPKAGRAKLPPHQTTLHLSYPAYKQRHILCHKLHALVMAVLPRRSAATALNYFNIT